MALSDNGYDEDTLSKEIADSATEDNKTNEEVVLKSLISPTATAGLGLMGSFISYHIVGSIVIALVAVIAGYELTGKAMLISNGLGQIIFMLIPILALAKFLYGKNYLSLFKFNKLDIQLSLLIFIGLILVMFLGTNITLIQNSLVSKTGIHIKILEDMTKMLEEAYKKMIVFHSWQMGAIVFGVVAIIPAFVEEIVFRGFIQGSLFLNERKRYGYYIAITSFFFALYHFNFEGFFALWLIGAYLGFAVYKSGSIFLAIALHFFNNALAVISLNLAPDKLDTPLIAQNGNLLQMVFETSVLLLLLGLIFFLIQKRRFSDGR